MRAGKMGNHILKIIIFLLFFVSGCAVLNYENSGDIGSPKKKFSKPSLSSELKLELWAQPQNLSPGDTLSVYLTVTNEMNFLYSRGFSSGCVYGFGLWNARGDLVAPPARVCTMNAPIIKFQPGETRSIEFHWVWNDTLVEPGLYQLYAGFGPYGEYESGDKATFFL